MICSRGGFLSGYPIARKNPDPRDKKSLGYPEGKKSRIPDIKIPRLKNPNPGDKNPETEKKITNPGDLPKIPGIFRKCRKNPDSQKIV